MQKKMVDEQLKIRLDVGRDRVKEIFDEGDTITVIMESKGQSRPITISKSMVMDVQDIINRMEIGESYKSKFVYNRYIQSKRIKSKLLMDRMNILKDVLMGHNLNKEAVDNIINELENNEAFSKLDFKELLGTRGKEGNEASTYFKIYASLRYLANCGFIEYKSSGQIVRLE